ncbi:MAG: glycoside hydrolase family 65 protein, partial [Elusimicrobia bacterium]|nr:glycoside hydrolase family 65 protein [Elusimicrobiota bacterium]
IMQLCEKDWAIVYDKINPKEELLREALCTVGNGYMGIRGSAPESLPSENHYPGIYLAGLYNRLPTRMAGKTIINEDMVNCPNFFCMNVGVGGGKWFSPDLKKEIKNFRQCLDMKRGIFSRQLVWEEPNGKKTFISFSRIASMENPLVAAMIYRVKPLNYSGKITVKTMIDGSVQNTGVARYRKLNCQHWTNINPLAKGNFAFLTAETKSPKILLVIGTKTEIFCSGRKINAKRESEIKDKNKICEEFSFYAEKGSLYEVCKTAVVEKLHPETKNPVALAEKKLKKTRNFHKISLGNSQRWQKIWESADVKIEGDNFTQKILRLHAFHLFQTACHNSVGLDVAIPARGLHGEAYRGHIFWDEIFVSPFYNSHMPEVTRASLLYRYRRLKAARRYARENGYKGAMFPWQSASSGLEETQVIHLNPLSGKWDDDHSRLQRHISFAIAYNLWKYYQATLDYDFMRDYGNELMLSIGQFCASLVSPDKKDGRYHTHNLMGPDEFHEKLPWSKSCGLKDNAYSNFMIAWILAKSLELLDAMTEKERNNLFKKLSLKENDIKRWKDISGKMAIVFGDNEIISQFDGYFRLKELDFGKYRKKYGNIHRMDRILRAEGKSPDDYKVSKQADALMIFYLFNYEEFAEIFGNLGYEIDLDVIRKNYDYYVKRTSHGSTLSKLVHCYIAHQVGYQKQAQKWYLEVLKSDYHDIQGGTTKEGVHIGVMGGSLDITLRCFAGLKSHHDKLFFSPNLPPNWKSMKFNFSYRGKELRVEIGRKNIKIRPLKRSDSRRNFEVFVRNKKYEF